MKKIQALGFTGTLALVLACASGCGESEGGAALQGGEGGRDASSQGGSSVGLSGGRSASSGGRNANSGGSTSISRGGSSGTSAGAAGELATAGVGGEEPGSGGVSAQGGTSSVPRGGTSGTGTPVGSGGANEAGADAGGAANGGAGGGEDAGGAGGAAAAACPVGVPANKAACAEAQTCSYPNMVCVCSGAEDERRWSCENIMEKCPPKLPMDGAECKALGSEPPSCAYTDGSVCTCDAQAKWQCTK